MIFDDKKEKKNLNAHLILQDISTRARGPAGYGAVKSELRGADSMGDVCKAIVDDKKKDAAEPSGTTEPDLADENKRLQEEQQKKALELQKETELRNRARDIQNQIRWWEQQRGMGTHDDNQIFGQVSVLKSQLAGIDSKYWY